MKTLMLAVLFLGCDIEVNAPSTPQTDCKEFDYTTTRNGDAVTCRILWCQKYFGNAGIGGPTKLWCAKP